MAGRNYHKNRMKERKERQRLARPAPKRAYVSRGRGLDLTPHVAIASMLEAERVMATLFERVRIPLIVLDNRHDLPDFSDSVCPGKTT